MTWSSGSSCCRYEAVTVAAEVGWWPVWPDSMTFCYFDKILKVFWQFFFGYIVFGNFAICIYAIFSLFQMAKVESRKLPNPVTLGTTWRQVLGRYDLVTENFKVIWQAKMRERAKEQLSQHRFGQMTTSSHLSLSLLIVSDIHIF